MMLVTFFRVDGAFLIVNRGRVTMSSASSELEANTKEFCRCGICDEGNIALYICTMPKCSKSGLAFCLDCGKSSHRKKDHQFQSGLDHITTVALDSIHENITVN